MSKENDFATRMTGDSTLMAILTGGVYKSESVGIEGITRETATGAFSGGYLLPCALIHQRGAVPDGQISDGITPRASYGQAVEIYLYQDSGAGYSAIDSAMLRLFVLFHGYSFSDSFPVEWVNTMDRLRDQGALNGAGMARMDFMVRSIRS